MPPLIAALSDKTQEVREAVAMALGVLRDRRATTPLVAALQRCPADEQGDADLTDMDVHAAYKIAKRLYEQAPEADGVFVPCPRWPTITDVDLLEREIGKPVVTSCQAYIWHALKMAKVKPEVNGYGRLMASLAE